MHHVKTLFWDIDGVLVDTELLHFQAWQMLINKFGKTLTMEEYLPLIGRGSKENMEDICALKDITNDYEKLNKIRRDYYMDLREKGIPAIAPNVQLVKECAEKFPDINQVVVSSASRKDISENLLASDLQNYFKTIISFQDTPNLRRKPAPDIYFFALKHTGTGKDVALVLEDSLSGVLSAKSAGLKCIALPNELTIHQPLGTVADFVIPPSHNKNITEILKLAE